MQQIFSDRLAQLRKNLLIMEAHGMIVPRNDRFQGEQVAAGDERLAWLTGFTGSAGYAVILPTQAALFLDGRYTLQGQNQVDSTLYKVFNSAESSPLTWLSEHLEPNMVICYDPWLHTYNQIKIWQRICDGLGIQLMPTKQNPIDQLWLNRPAPPLTPMVNHKQCYAGQESEEKREALAKELNRVGAEAVIISSLESIAWLLNIRGQDLACTPVSHCTVIFYCHNEIDLFVNLEKIDAELESILGSKVHLRSPEYLEERLGHFLEHRIMVDPDHTPMHIILKLKQENATLIYQSDPCALPRAIKNSIEVTGARLAHIRDGAAVVKFLSWLDYNLAEGEIVTEIKAADYLEQCRKQQNLFKGLSFPSISAFGPHGAMAHYRPTEQSDAIIQGDTLYLIDSGGQYLDGTTDITRTIAIGTPTSIQKEHFTRVLKGHIALATAIFPHGTTGNRLDTLARLPLWQAGLDYNHGTGHGVGSYLDVHEGPQRISKAASTIPLQPGMIISNEPGYYKEGAYGIRIENLVTVVPIENLETPMLGFETLTLAPIDRNLIEISLLSPTEIEWVNSYHQKVRDTLLPLVDDQTKAWLIAATERI